MLLLPTIRPGAGIVTHPERCTRPPRSSVGGVGLGCCVPRLRTGAPALRRDPRSYTGAQGHVQRPDPEADALRSRALSLIAQDPTRVPDHMFSVARTCLGMRGAPGFFAEDGAIAQRA